MKNLFLKLFLRPKITSQIASAISGLIAGYVVSVLPNAPEIVTNILGVLMDLPEGSTITQAGVVATVTPLVMILVNAIVQKILTGDNDKALAELQKLGVYNGTLDGWVGPEATRAIQKLEQPTYES